MQGAAPCMIYLLVVFSEFACKFTAYTITFLILELYLFIYEKDFNFKKNIISDALSGNQFFCCFRLGCRGF